MTRTNTGNTTDTSTDAAADAAATPHFVDRLAEHYRPAPLGRAQQAQFDANLRERLERRRLPVFWAPALGGAVAALFFALWIGGASTTLLPQPTLDSQLDFAVAELNWEADVLLVDADAQLAEEDYLPDEYRAIAFVFLDEM